MSPTKCTDCHTPEGHDDEAQWWLKKDGPPPKGHVNALKQLADRKSPDFGKAIGLADVYDMSGSCIACHATVFKGKPRFGVSCESCHGAGSGYFEIHQEKGAYQKAVAAGMRDNVGKLATWAPMCMNCHVLDDARLIKAGHPSGDDFDLGAKFAPTVHWQASYSQAMASAEGRRAAAPIVARRGAAPPPPTEVPPPTPPAPPPQPPSPGPATAPGTGSVPAPGPLTAPVPAPGSGSVPGPRPPTGDPAAGTTPTPPGAPPRTTTPPPVRTTPPPRPSLPPVVEQPQVTPPVVAGPAATPVPAAVAPPPAALPRSPAAAVAEVQGRAIALLNDLLRRGARAPARVKPPERPTLYRGADAELLRLQEEVLALALEALGTAPRGKK